MEAAANRRPVCQVTGKDGNVFNIIALVRRALINDGQRDRAEEWAQKAGECDSYDEVLGLMFDYVDPE